MRYFENTQKNHDKFYKIGNIEPRLLEWKTIFVVDTWRWKIWTKWQWIVYDFETEEEAKKWLHEIQQKRIQNGYTEKNVEYPQLELIGNQFCISV